MVYVAPRGCRLPAMEELTEFERLFVDSYVIDRIGQRAIRRLRPELRDTSAATEASRMLRKVNVRAAVDAKLREIGLKFEMTAADVLSHWIKLARADPKSISRIRNVNCRHCYGIAHLFQWKDVNEWAAAIAAEAKDAAKNNRDPAPPSAEGGFGFIANLSPHAKCPQCLGEGKLDLFIADSHDIPEEDACLLAGYKQTKNGIEVLYHDQQAALLHIARYLGMVKTDVNVKGGLKIDAGATLTDEQQAVLKDALDKLL